MIQMKQEISAQNKRSETSGIIDKVETMKEENKKLLSPKGAIDFSEHNSSRQLRWFFLLHVW
jgi:hypothetical protein